MKKLFFIRILLHLRATVKETTVCAKVVSTSIKNFLEKQLHQSTYIRKYTYLNVDSIGIKSLSFAVSAGNISDIKVLPNKD